MRHLRDIIRAGIRLRNPAIQARMEGDGIGVDCPVGKERVAIGPAYRGVGCD